MERRRNQVQPPTESTPPVNQTVKNETTRSIHAEKVLAGLQKQRLGGQFLDFTIHAADNVTVRAHRNVLSAFSPYFEALFGSNMADSGVSEVRLRDLNGNAVRDIVDFAYTGTLDISSKNVPDLLAVSSFLCVDSVIGGCCSYLQDNLSAVNCFEILLMSDTYDRVELHALAWNFILERLEDVTKDDGFFRIPIQLLLEILETDELTFTKNGFPVLLDAQEEQILEATLRYVDAEAECRLEHLPMLLERGVRLRLMTSAALETVKRNPLVAESPDSVGLIDEALDSNVSNRPNEEGRRWSRPRVNRTPVQYRGTRMLSDSRAIVNEDSVAFDDSESMKTTPVFYVTGMKIYMRRWDGVTPVVGGIEVSYSNGSSILHGSDGYGYENYEFSLDPDERITSITPSSGWLIVRFTFTTNKGKILGPYGGPGGDQQTFSSPNPTAYLAYLSGIVVFTQNATAVRHLRFFWGFRPMESHKTRD